MAPLTPTMIRQRIWEGRIPLQINLSPLECRTYDQADPYLISCPRVSYLPFLLPRLLAFYASSLIEPDVQAHQGWFSFEGVPLKWHHPIGLLFDLYANAEPVTSSSSSSALGGMYPSSFPVNPGQTQKQSHDEHQGNDDGASGEAGDDEIKDEEGSEYIDGEAPFPWKLTVHFTNWPDQDLVRLDEDGRVLHDAFVNSVKEADFLRNGTAKAIMTLSKDDSSGLWEAVQNDDFLTHQRINNILISNPTTPLRNIPLRVFLPSPPDADTPSLKVIQSPFPPVIPAAAASPTSGRPSQPQRQTVGTVLNKMLPTLFPSRRIPVLAKPVLHGAVLPMTSPVDEVVKTAPYADGWLNVVISMVR